MPVRPHPRLAPAPPARDGLCRSRLRLPGLDAVVAALTRQGVTIMTDAAMASADEPTVDLAAKNAILRAALERLADSDDEPQDDDIDLALIGTGRWGWEPTDDPEEQLQRRRDLRHAEDGYSVIALAALVRADCATEESR
ncbi:MULTISPECIES: hypothetical protein [Protofrankia]|uniref:Uncharacterized protein n=1 Tax=Protofrankia coriariae TaxID=1562887 RepID=A0ABR5F4B1_9ACTN|nr:MULTISPECIES: hypothetical protein [Protofrankia]KLL11567.1 hypothetical protein FrCorBMG51_11040 [Protofrankia coriariae]ONH35701.1 hypothetical protein BL254_10435 [Protofrankia sp. BMG5.30]